MAEALFRQALPQVRVVSAGTSAMVGRPADTAAQHLMLARGLDLSTHRAQQVSRAMCQQAEIILVMDQWLQRLLKGQYPTATGKVFRLGEFADADVPDPYQQPLEVFATSLSLIDIGVKAWIQRINKI